MKTKREMTARVESNLSPERIAILESELVRLPSGRFNGVVRIYDRTLAGLPPAAADIALKAAVGEAPLEIEPRWAWERQRQSYAIGGTGESPLIVGGGPEGAMYGFYRWLREAGGCRWPTMVDAENPTGLEPRPLPQGVVAPATAWRGYEGSLKSWDTGYVLRLFRWMLRNGWNLLLINATHWRSCGDCEVIMRAAKLHGVRIVLGAHAVDSFLPEELFGQHPAYFGMRDGVRGPYTETSFPDIPGKVSRMPVQPCYGNPATRSFLAEKIAAFIDDNRGIAAFSLWPHDGANNWCECEMCRCDTPYRLMHLLAKEILDKCRYPVSVEMLAYCNLLTPPETPLPPDPRTYVLFCPYLRRYEHRLDDPGFPPEAQQLGRNWPAKQPVNPNDDREYGRLFEEWRPWWQAAGTGLGLFTYYQLAFADHTKRSDRSRYLYFRDLELLAYEIGFFQRAGMGTFYDCSWPLPGLWPDARYAEVVVALLWDPASDVGKLEADYYRDNLGESGAAVCAMMHKISRALDDRERAPLSEELLQEARRVLAFADTKQAERYLLWLDYIKLADVSWQARRANDIAAVEATEAAIQQLFDKGRELLEPHLLVSWMERLSHSMTKLPG